MKTKTSLILVAVLLSVVVIIVSATAFSPKNKEKRAVVQGLKSYTWLGLWIDMPGLFCPTREVFGSPLRLTFLTNHTCSLEIRDQVIRAWWMLKDDTIFLRGKGLKAKGYLSLDQSSFAESYFFLNIENYFVLFSSDDGD